MPARKQGDDKKEIQSLRKAMSLASIGFLLVISTGIGFFFGRWLDEKLGTEPWFMLLFTILGITAGFIEMIKLISEADED